jgi:hypothetical protein
MFSFASSKIRGGPLAFGKQGLDFHIDGHLAGHLFFLGGGKAQARHFAVDLAAAVQGNAARASLFGIVALRKAPGNRRRLQGRQRIEPALIQRVQIGTRLVAQGKRLQKGIFCR